MYSDNFVLAIQAFLLSKKSEYDDVLGNWNLSLKRVYEFYTEVVPLDHIPCIMMGDQLDVQKKWEGAHYHLSDLYTTELSGFVVYADNKANARAIRQFADITSQLFEHSSAEEIEAPDFEWKFVWPENSPPASQVEIGYQFIGEAFCRAFHITIAYQLERTALIHGAMVTPQ